MKEQLEPMDLIPYLPYSLKVIMEGKKTNIAWMSTKNIAVIIPDGVGEYEKIPWKRAHFNIKPILRRLSYLTKEITHNDETFIPLHELLKDNFFDLEKMTEERINEFEQTFLDTHSLSYKDAITLCSWHYDIFNLIEKGLAYDINKLEQNVN